MEECVSYISQIKEIMIYIVLDVIPNFELEMAFFCNEQDLKAHDEVAYDTLTHAATKIKNKFSAASSIFRDKLRNIRRDISYFINDITKVTKNNLITNSKMLQFKTIQQMHNIRKPVTIFTKHITQSNLNEYITKISNVVSFFEMFYSSKLNIISATLLKDTNTYCQEQNITDDKIITHLIMHINGINMTLHALGFEIVNEISAIKHKMKCINRLVNNIDSDESSDTLSTSAMSESSDE
jgi:hypothetical protein